MKIRNIVSAAAACAVAAAALVIPTSAEESYVAGITWQSSSYYFRNTIAQSELLYWDNDLGEAAPLEGATFTDANITGDGEYTVTLDGVNDGGFVAVRSGGVNGTVSGSNRIFYGFLAFLEVANLVHTENGGRHQYAVGKRDVGNPRHLFSPKAADRRTSNSAAAVFPMPIILGQRMGTQLRQNKPIFCLFLPRRC